MRYFAQLESLNLTFPVSIHSLDCSLVVQLPSLGPSKSCVSAAHQDSNQTWVFVPSIQDESTDHLASFLNCYPLNVSVDNHKKQTVLIGSCQFQYPDWWRLGKSAEEFQGCYCNFPLRNLVFICFTFCCISYEVTEVTKWIWEKLYIKQNQLRAIQRM